MNINQGNISIPMIIMIIIAFSVVTFFYFIQLDTLDKRVANVGNDTVNITGISYDSEIFIASDELSHTMTAEIMPLMIFVLLLIGVIILCCLIYAILKR